MENSQKKMENAAVHRLSAQSTQKQAEKKNEKQKNQNKAAEEFPDKIYEYDAEQPPKIQIVAVMKSENKTAACVNIKDIAEGIILVPGMNLFDHGKVDTIDETGIKWTWNGKQYKTGLEK